MQPEETGTLPASEMVVLVDEADRNVGSAEKLFAHRRGLLHRAFSVFVVNGRGELLLQQRSRGKYHSGGLWSNACCGHPRPGEQTDAAAVRRLYEELGANATLEPAGSFRYRAELEGSLVEHEIDHVFVGRIEGPLEPDPREVCDLRWVSAEALHRELNGEPARFTAWFASALRCLPVRRPAPRTGLS